MTTSFSSSKNVVFRFTSTAHQLIEVDKSWNQGADTIRPESNSIRSNANALVHEFVGIASILSLNGFVFTWINVCVTIISVFFSFYPVWHTNYVNQYYFYVQIQTPDRNQ